MENYKKTILELIKKYKHKDLVIELRNILISESKSKDLKPNRILYCNSYGNFEYSQAFMIFLNYDDIWIDDRIGVVKKLKEFGKDCILKYPEIARLVTIYNYYDLGKVFTDIKTIYIYENNLSYLMNLLEKTKNSNQTYGNSDEFIEDSLLYHLDITKYTKLNIIISCEQAILILINKINDLKTCLKNHNIKELLDFYSLHKTTYTYIGFIEFADAPTKSKWNYQKYYDAHAMQYIELYPNIYNYNNIELTLANTHIEDIGLLYASTNNCLLKIKEIPALLDWRISEFDGLESIITL